MKGIIFRVYVKKAVLLLIIFFGLIYIGNMAPQSWVLASIKSKVINYTDNIDIRHGDFIFQDLPGKLLEVISDVTQSPYTHCGIVVAKKDGLYVLEAIGPVKETPINKWISYGKGQKITLVRLKESYQKFIPNIIRSAYRYKGRPYDIQYLWDDKKIYCSELIYKAASSGAGLMLAPFSRLGDMNWQPHEEFIRQISGGDLPLKRLMITPHDLVFSEKVDIVYSSFPQSINAGKDYRINEFAGVWGGDYMIVNQRLPVQVAIDEKGSIQYGSLGQGLTLGKNAFEEFDAGNGKLSFLFRSENAVKVKIDAFLSHNKDVVYGKWRDSLGFKGTFNLRKEVVR